MKDATGPVAAVFAGCRPHLDDELRLARDVGRLLGTFTKEIRLGGYNGLMEEVAHHASLSGGRVVAPLLDGSDAWGPMNPHVDRVVPCTSYCDRMDFYMSADFFVGLPGGVGTLYEICAALWHTTTYTVKPIWLVGERCHRLYSLLLSDAWVFRTPTRPTSHIRLLQNADDLAAAVTELRGSGAVNSVTHGDNSQLLGFLRGAVLCGPVRLPNGRTADRYFDEYRVWNAPSLLAACTEALSCMLDSRKYDGIAGIATAGLPLATLLAQRLQLPLFVVRAAPRSYGTATAIEGGSIRGRELLVVDGVVRTGATAREAVRRLRVEGASTDTVLAVLDREDGGKAALAAEGVALVCAATWSQLDHSDTWISRSCQDPNRVA